MDKETLSHYGWIVVTILIISIMIGLATPFAVTVKNSFIAMTDKLTNAAGNGWGVIESGGDESGSPGEEVVMLDGDGQTFYKGNPEDISYRSSASIDKLQSVLIDGEVVDPSNYTITEGSTIITFLAEFLATLDEKDFSVTVVSTTGAAKAALAVVDDRLDHLAGAHNYNVKTVSDKFLASAATCKSPAKYYYRCECGARSSNTFTIGSAVVDAHVPGAEATCTTNQLCTLCGVKLNSAFGHTETTTAAVAPTCTETGLTTGKHCSVCNEVLVAQQVVSAKGHTPGAAAACTTDQKCTVCQAVLVSAKGHTPGAAATCTNPQNCTVCGEVITTENGHVPGAEATCTTNQSCTVCGAELKAALGHTEVSDAAVAPTCTETGLTAGKHCSVCNEILVAQQVIDAKGHTPGAAATCTTDQKCTVCQEVLKAATGHNYNNVVTTPTCTAEGYTTHTCSKCGDTYKDTYTDAKGHTPGAAATCTTEQKCTVCQAVLKAALGHTEVADAAVAPTCTEAGLTAGKHCSVCDEILVAQQVVSAKGHTPGTAATCTNPQSCTVCGEELATAGGHVPGAEATCTTAQKCTVCQEVLKAATGHNYNSVVTAPTCTRQGYTTHTCSKCSDTYKDTYVDATGHNYVDSACTKCGEPKPLLAGLYETGSNYTVLLKDWDTLVSEGILTSEGKIASGQEANLAGDLVIPDGVTSIGERAFDGCASLTSINIPNSVTSIGLYAFRGCANLTSVDIPDGVTSIGAGTFYDCIKLTGINIPDSITSIGSDAFNGCANLTSINIPDSVTSISGGTFKGCESLTSVNIPNSVTSIGDDAFEDCESLTSINIPDSVTSISGGTFSGCYNLTSVNIPDGVTSIGDAAFYNCRSLTGVNIPDSVTSIGRSAFLGCANLTSVDIPDGVTSIGYSTFYNCASLTSINIPNSVTSIGGDAFLGCRSLTNINIPNSVTSIGESAFCNCASLTSINIPNSVTSIGDDAFLGCESLTSINIPNSVTSIGRNAFYACRSLTNIDIPDSVTSIGDAAFYACTALVEISFSGTVTKWNAVTKGFTWDYYISATYIQCSDGRVCFSEHDYDGDVCINCGKVNEVQLSMVTIWAVKNSSKYTFSYVSGMTWQEFINSEYNTDEKFAVDSNGYVTMSVLAEPMFDNNLLWVTADKPVDFSAEYCVDGMTKRLFVS